MPEQHPGFYTRLTRYFLPSRPETTEQQQSYDRIFVNISLITSVFSFLYAVISIVIGFHTGILLQMVCVCLLIGNTFHFRRRGHYRLSVNLYLASCLLVSILGCSFFTGGIRSMVAPWLALIPVAGILMLGFRHDTVLWCAGSATSAVVLGALDIAGYRAPVQYDTRYTGLFFTICLSGLVLMLFSIAIVFDNNRKAIIRRILEHNGILTAATYTDALTGLQNRRKFDEQFETSWNEALRTQTPLSVIIMDVDHFKQYNDHYGHQAGDHCLRSVGGALSRTIRRKTDIVCRFGGEEFVCALPDTDAVAALALAESLRRDVLSLQIPHEASAASPVVSISLGVSTAIPGTGTRSADLIAEADKALYQSKREGRNRVSVR